MNASGRFANILEMVLLPSSDHSAHRAGLQLIAFGLRDWCPVLSGAAQGKRQNGGGPPCPDSERIFWSQRSTAVANRNAYDLQNLLLFLFLSSFGFLGLFVGFLFLMLVFVLFAGVAHGVSPFTVVYRQLTLAIMRPTPPLSLFSSRKPELFRLLA
jgi:hypothetical protein